MTPQLNDKVRRRLDHYALVLDQQYPDAREIPNAPARAPSRSPVACGEEFIVPPPSTVSVESMAKVLLYQADGTPLVRKIGYAR